MNTEVRSTSPAGRYAIQVSPWEARMSLWIESPTLIDLETDKTLLSFRDANWSLDSAKWLNDFTVVVQLRKYPGDHTPSSLGITIDCAAGTATVDATTLGNLGDLEEHLDNILRWPGRPRAASSVGWRKWLASLLGK